MWILLSGAAVGIVLFLSWNLYTRFGADRIEAFNEKRRATSRIVGRGEFVDGNRRLAVALALTGSVLHYENSDMEASVDMQWVRDVEYDTRLATGQTAEGGKVLRLRCFSQVFEFVLPDNMVARWHTMLPARSSNAPVVVAPALTELAPAVIAR